MIVCTIGLLTTLVVAVAVIYRRRNKPVQYRVTTTYNDGCAWWQILWGPSWPHDYYGN